MYYVGANKGEKAKTTDKKKGKHRSFALSLEKGGKRKRNTIGGYENSRVRKKVETESTLMECGNKVTGETAGKGVFLESKERRR